MNLFHEFNKTYGHTTSLAREMTKLHQQLAFVVEIMLWVKDRMTKLEHWCNSLISQAASYANVKRMPNITPNIFQTPSSTEHLKKIENAVPDEKTWKEAATDQNNSSR